jgi:spore germination protein KA
MQGELIIIRLVFLLSASFIGLYGYFFCIVAMFLHLASLRSFGIPYMLDIGTFRPADAKDIMVRVPWKKMKTRPKLVVQQNKKRIADDSKEGDEGEN